MEEPRTTSSQEVARYFQRQLEARTMPRTVEESGNYTAFETGERCEGKEQLLLEITEDINASLEKLVDASGVEAAYFESFLIQ